MSINSVALGTDIVSIQRVQKALARSGEVFLRRIFDGSELLMRGDVGFLATRFAAKEAVAKGLGTGIGAVSWQEIEILRKPSGEPELFLHGKAQKLAADIGISTWSISLTHSRNHAIAFFVGIGFWEWG